MTEALGAKLHRVSVLLLPSPHSQSAAQPLDSLCHARPGLSRMSAGSMAACDLAKDGQRGAPQGEERALACRERRRVELR